MSKNIGYEGLSDLTVGQKVEYKAGLEDHRVEAIATVTGNPGATGVYVRIDSLTIKGEKVKVKEGDEIIAGALEVYI